MAASFAPLVSAWLLFAPPDESASRSEQANADESDAPNDDEDDRKHRGHVRVVRVRTHALGGGSPEDVFRHAGGRAVVERDEFTDRGAAGVGEAVRRVPGVRAVEGISTVGARPGALNIAVRGANPRLSGESTVLLDEVPIAMAPYSQPELAMFPVSLFSIERIDLVKHGASVRFGPTTSGGVFNIVSRPIPQLPTVSVASRVDHFGHVNTGVGFGTTVRRFGVWSEYTPTFGRDYRDGSDFHTQSGTLRMAYAFTPRIDLTSATHYWWEEAALMGGVNVDSYLADPRANTRPDDRLDGWRVGETLQLHTHPRENHAFSTALFYYHSYRNTRIVDTSDVGVRELPRTYDTVGLEPRYTVRLHHKQGPFHDLAFGVRGMLEQASLIDRQQFQPDMPFELAQDYDARTGALAAFVEDEVYLLDERLILRAGLRGELGRFSRRNNLLARAEPELAVDAATIGQLMPAVSIWGSPREEIAAYASYGRSYAAPNFIQLASGAGIRYAFLGETVDTVEVGTRLYGDYGLSGTMTGWFRSMKSIRDIGLDTVDVVGDAYAAGVEIDAEWEPGEIWDVMTGSEIYVGAATMDSVIHRSQTYKGKELPWYPELEVWGGIGYSLPFPCDFIAGVEGPPDCRAFKIGADVEWSSEQYSNFINDARGLVPGDRGFYGVIPSYVLLDAYTRFRVFLPQAWVLNLSIGVKNMLDEQWYYRSDDRNGGILAQRPRTFYLDLAVSHVFVRAWEKAQERREQRSAQRLTRRKVRG